MKVYTLHTDVSKYRARRDQSGNWTILSRDGDSSFRGEVINGAPDRVGPPDSRRLTIIREDGGKVYHTRPITQVVPDPDLIDRTALLAEFDELAKAIDFLGRGIGFEGIHRKAGMDSVAAAVADLRRAITRA